MSSSSRSLPELNCQSRMFLLSLCLSEADLAQLGVVAGHSSACVSVSTAARTALHRACAEDVELARLVSDMLDLRHFEHVLHVRAHAAEELVADAQRQARSGNGADLVAWAWALCTDARANVSTLGQRLMADVYVRGLQTLAHVA